MAVYDEKKKEVNIRHFQMKYEGVVVYRFDEIISAVTVDVKTEKHFSLTVMVNCLLL